LNKLTRGGVALNFEESPYRYNIIYGDSSITYVFSSEFYRKNFIKKFVGNRKKINESLSNRFGFKISHDIICDLKLYSGIEKRGFLIYYNGARFECPKSIILDGETLTRTS
jgi:hypothetical protein